MRKRLQMHFRIFFGIFCLIFSMCFLHSIPASAEGMKEEEILEENEGKAVKIETGFKDNSGNFHKLSSTTGYIISQSESNCYILASYSGCDYADETFEKYCKDHKIKKDEISEKKVIVMVYDEDVQYLLKDGEDNSENQNFCILEKEAMQNKEPVVFLTDETDSEDVNDPGNAIKQDDTAYVISYDLGDDDSELDILKVKIVSPSTDVAKEEGQYITFTTKDNVVVPNGYLVDQNGYLMGLVRSDFQEYQVEEGKQYALKNYLYQDILVSRNIPYKTRSQQEFRKQLKDLLNGYIEIVEDESSYKHDEYYEAFKEREAEIAKEAENIYLPRNDSKEYLEELIQLETKLKKKMPLTLKIQIVLGIIIALILPFFVWKVILYFRVRNQYHELVGKPKKKKKKGKEKAVSEDYLLLLNGEKMPLSPQTNIGRDEDRNDVVFHDFTMSKEHAQIILRKGTYYIIDRSSNGTFINGFRIQRGKPWDLNDADEIRMGNTIMRICLTKKRGK